MLAEALFATSGVRISFPSGDTLKGRAINSGDVIDAPINSTLCGMAVRKGVPLEFSNAQTNPEANACPAVRQSRVSFYSNRLIRVRGGEIVGTLCLYDPTPRTLTAREREWLDALPPRSGNHSLGLNKQIARLLVTACNFLRLFKRFFLSGVARLPRNFEFSPVAILKSWHFRSSGPCVRLTICWLRV